MKAMAAVMERHQRVVFAVVMDLTTTLFVRLMDGPSWAGFGFGMVVFTVVLWSRW